MKKVLQKLYPVFGVLGITAFFLAFYTFMEARSLLLNASGNTPATAQSSHVFGSLIPVAQAVYLGKPNPQCLDNYTSLPSSTTFKSDAPWSTAFAQATDLGSPNMIVNNFERDLNGDGLADYAFIYHYSQNNSIGTRDCVALSNGTGWDVVYRCYADNSVTPPKFYGDCAE